MHHRRGSTGTITDLNLYHWYIKKNLLIYDNVKILSMLFGWQKTVRKNYSWKKLIMENLVQHIAEHRSEYSFHSFCIADVQICSGKYPWTVKRNMTIKRTHFGRENKKQQANAGWECLPLLHCIFTHTHRGIFPTRTVSWQIQQVQYNFLFMCTSK